MLGVLVDQLARILQVEGDSFIYRLCSQKLMKCKIIMKFLIKKCSKYYSTKLIQFYILFSLNQARIFIKIKINNNLSISNIQKSRMGNSQASKQKKIVHDLYGETKTFQVANSIYHEVSFPVKELESGQNFVNLINQTNDFNRKHLLIGTNLKAQERGLCGNSGLVKCTFPYFPHTLLNQIKSRQKQGRFLRKSQLLNLVYQIVDGARNFDRTDRKVGDIRPSNILLDEDKKNIKLINYYTSPLEDSGLVKAYQNSDRPFLAPQQLRFLQKNISRPQLNQHKADSFSLGMTIIANGNLKSLEQLYDYSNYNINYAKLNQQTTIFEKRYGQFMAEIVRGLTMSEPRERLYIGQIGAILQFYEKQIYEMIEFEPDYILMQKSYETNYSGLKSQRFVSWLRYCRQSSGFSSNIINVQKASSHIVSIRPPVRVSVLVGEVVQPRMNSSVRFTYLPPDQWNKQVNLNGNK